MTGRHCREKVCNREIVLVQLDSGRWIPLDPEAIPAARTSLVALNHDTLKAHVLSKRDVDSGDADRWAMKAPVTFHRAHMATCEARRQQKLIPDDKAA